MFKYFILAILIGYFFVHYHSIEQQKKDYEGNISMRLEGACAALIQDDFAQHATSFNVTPTIENAFIGKESLFSGNNDLLFLTLEGRSMIYFDSFAPQEITCRATIKIDKGKLTKNTKVDFYIVPPNYLPKGYKSYLKEHTDITLTIAQIEQLSPLTSIFPLGKPTFSVFGFTSLDQLIKFITT
ncbi:MAG TPA: hypothetical protein VLG50_02000 [Candidatus Saccharimonadales bacterium]|nr:hypothetical protein [Candidatus Saccharimonadales bacterium]